MSLEVYFQKLIEQAESSEEISNAGTDKDGFYKPTKTILLRHLNLLKDLHATPPQYMRSQPREFHELLIQDQAN